MSIQRAKVLVFDLDGTILYTLESIARAGNRMLEALGLAAQPVDAYRYFCGDGSDNLVRRCLKAVNAYNEENFKKGAALNRALIAEDALYAVRPYEGMPEVLKTLKESGFSLAVFSNKPDEAVQAAIRGTYGELFDLVRGQLADIPLKPDPAGALKIAEEFGVRPADCVYFGDTWTDMQTGRAAGMYTCGVLWGYRDREELLDNGAECLLERPSDILSLPMLLAPCPSFEPRRQQGLVKRAGTMEKRMI